MPKREFKSGDQVVFHMMKHKTQPSRRAQGIQPAANGDTYSYYVRKFWVVSSVYDDGTLLLRTPRGKTRTVHADDPSLMHASLLDKIFHRNELTQSEAAASSASAM